MNHLAWMIANCSSVHLECNQHHCYYQSATEAFDDKQSDMLSDATPEIRAECIARDCILSLQVYPYTPVGFVHWVHYDSEVLLREAYEYLVTVVKPVGANVKRHEPDASEPE